MAKQDVKTASADFALGPIAFDLVALVNRLPVQTFARNGCVLVNERTKVQVPFSIGDGASQTCDVTVSLYISRGAMTDNEARSVAAAKESKDADRRERERNDAEKLAREKQAAAALGRDSVIEALRNLGHIAPALTVLGALGGPTTK